MSFEYCAACGAPSGGAYRCAECTGAEAARDAPHVAEALVPLPAVDSAARLLPVPFHPIVFPLAGPITLLVWGRPKRRWALFVIYGVRFAFVMAAITVLIVAAIVPWTR